jgi:hypothetical protein
MPEPMVMGTSLNVTERRVETPLPFEVVYVPNDHRPVSARSPINECSCSLLALNGLSETKFNLHVALAFDLEATTRRMLMGARRQLSGILDPSQEALYLVLGRGYPARIQTVIWTQ